MKVELRATDSVRPYENNPRVNDAAVARSLERFGFRRQSRMTCSAHRPT